MESYWFPEVEDLGDIMLILFVKGMGESLKIWKFLSQGRRQVIVTEISESKKRLQEMFSSVWIMGKYTTRIGEDTFGIKNLELG